MSTYIKSQYNSLFYTAGTIVLPTASEPLRTKTFAKYLVSTRKTMNQLSRSQDGQE